MNTEEKQSHSDEADKVLEHPILERAMQEFARNMHFELEGLPRMGLMKVAFTGALLGRAQALGIDPEELRLTPEEGNQQVMDMALRAAEAGVPTAVVEVPEEES